MAIPFAPLSILFRISLFNTNIQSPQSNHYLIKHNHFDIIVGFVPVPVVVVGFKISNHIRNNFHDNCFFFRYKIKTLQITQVTAKEMK